MRPVIISKGVEATAGVVVDPSGELRKYGVLGTDIPSAATIDLGAATGDYVRITGTTNIQSFGVAPSGVIRTTEFTGILNLIYNSATLVLPGGVNLTTAPNDMGIFRSRGNGAWINVSWQPASGAPPLELTADDVGLGNVENIKLSTWPGSSNLTTVGTITAGVWQGTPIAPTKGGTGLTALTQGDIIYAGAANTYYRLSKSTVAKRYLSNQGGLDNSPAWAAIDLATGVTGILPEANGGGMQIPVGGVVDFAGSTNPPEGWLLCFGQSIARGTYAALFGVIGTTYGSVDAATFSLPDCRGRVAAGKDDMGGVIAGRLTLGISGINGTVLGGAGGSQSMHNHTHQYFALGGGGTFALAAGSQAYSLQSTAQTGGGAAENVQPTIIFNKIIRY